MMNISEGKPLQTLLVHTGIFYHFPFHLFLATSTRTVNLLVAESHPAPDYCDKSPKPVQEFICRYWLELSSLKS